MFPSKRQSFRAVVSLISGGVCLAGTPAWASKSWLDVRDGSSIVIVGNAMAEKMADHGYFEAALHCAFPSDNLVVRNMGWSGDQVADLTREAGFGDLDEHLSNARADVIFAFFGFNESFAESDGTPAFRTNLTAFIDARLAQNYNGSGPPQLVMVSPAPYRQVSPHLPDEATINANLGLYRDVMREVCREKQVRFLDVLTLLEERAGQNHRPFTSNGIHLNAFGYWMLSRILAEQLDLAEESPETDFWGAEAVRRLVNKKNFHWLNRWRPINGQFVYGAKKEPFGVVTFPGEFEQLDRIIDLADNTIWNLEKPGIASLWAKEPGTEFTYSVSDLPVDGAKPLPAVNGVARPAETQKSFTLPEELEVGLWASEEDAPLANPVAMNFDERGRLWVLCSPEHPHPFPGQIPDDYLLVLEDHDLDHKADRHTIFARNLFLPTGFALSPNGAYVAEQRSIFHYADRDDNGVADQRREVLGGFGTGDSQHAIAAFEWAPDGSLWFCQGRDILSRIESPYGPQIYDGSAVFRFTPRTGRLECVSRLDFANCWGQVFDGWGRGLLTDASNGQTFASTRTFGANSLTNASEQPVAGVELLASRHFPRSMRGAFVQNHLTGLQGTRWFRLWEEGAAMWMAQRGGNLLESSDPAFRPVAAEVGPDGALYILDFCNPIIGREQSTMHDPRRAKTHGRVWRISAKNKREFWRQAVRGEPVETLLEQLRAEEPNTRQHVRRELWRRNPVEVFAAAGEWLEDLERDDPNRQQLLTEALWLHQAHGRVNPSLLASLTESPDPRARAAAARGFG